MIDDGLLAVESQIHRTKTFLWWFVVPTMCAVRINMWFNFGGRPIWVWLIQPLGVLVFYVALLVEMKRSHVPRQRTLERLKSQLREMLIINRVECARPGGSSPNKFFPFWYGDRR